MFMYPDMPPINDPGVWFKDLFVHAGLSYSLSSFLSTIALVVIVILLSWLANLVAKAIILTGGNQDCKKDQKYLG